MFFVIVLMLLKSTSFMPFLCILNTTCSTRLYKGVTNTTIGVIKQGMSTHVVMVLLLMETGSALVKPLGDKGS